MLTREKEEALEHALTSAEQATHEVCMSAYYKTREQLASLLLHAKRLRDVWVEIIVELEKELK